MARTWPFSASNDLKQSANPSKLNFPGNSEQFTLSIWVKLNRNDATDQTLLSKYNGSIGPLMRTLGGKLRMFWIDSGAGGHEAIGATTMSTGTWYHCAATWPRSTSPGMQVWLNGVVDGADTTNGTMNTTSDTTDGWVIGARGNGGSADSNPLDAVACEVAMWNTAISAAEILALSKGINPFMIRPANLKGYWPIYGVAAPEADFTDTPANFSLVGTLNQANHGPVDGPTPTYFSYDHGLFASTGVPPSNTSPPVVTPTWAEKGRIEATTDGSWSGDATIVFTYGWQAADPGGVYSDIGGATSATYRIDSGYLGKVIRSKVTGTNGAGAATAFSASVGPVTDSPGSHYSSVAVG